MAIFFLPALLLYNISAAGQRSERQFGIGTGLYYHNFNDPTISSDNTGGSMSVLMYFRSSGEKNRHHLQILYATPRLQSSYLLTREQTGYFQYAYHRKIAVLKNRIHFFVGGVVDFSGSRSRYSEIGNSYSYSYPFTATESIISLNPSLLMEMPLEKDRITIQTWAAVIGYQLSESHRTLAVSDFSNIAARIAYIKCLSDRWDGRVEYQFQRYSLTKNENISSATHQAIFCVSYKFP